MGWRERFGVLSKTSALHAKPPIGPSTDETTPDSACIADTKAEIPKTGVENNACIADINFKTPKSQRGVVATTRKASALLPGAKVALVTTSPALPRKRRRGLLVSLDGTVICGQCDIRGQIPHHLSLIFWQFWTREQLSTLLEQMRPGERLAWIAHRLVRLQPASDISDAHARYLRAQDGRWSEDEG